MPDSTGSNYTYRPNDCSVGDLDGDGEYEIVLKWDPTNSKDNSQSGYTGDVWLDAYKLDGTRLWRIDLGRNIRAGAHYTQFMVYDLDSDGRAEVACKTADGTVDGVGNVIGDASADYRNSISDDFRRPDRRGACHHRLRAAARPRHADPDIERTERHLGRRLWQPLRPVSGVRRLPGRRAPQPGHVPRLLHRP
jgi:hypothetical protein